MTALKNIIKRQEVNFNYVGSADGVTLQQEVAVWIHDVLNPKIELWLKKYENSEEIIFIPELVLEVHVQAKTEWQHVLSEKIIQQLNEKFPVGKQKNEKVVLRKNHQSGFRDNLLYYIKNGFLSWNTQIQNREDLQTQISNWLRHTNVEDLQIFVEKLDSENAVDRYLSMISIDDMKILFTKLLKFTDDQFLILKTDINLLLDKDPNNNAWYPALFRQIKNTCDKDKNIDIDILMQAWLVGMPEMSNTNFNTVHLNKIQTETIKNILVQNQHQNQKPIPRVEQFPTQNIIKEELIKDSIYIKNAGVILIAPFLHTLFEKTGITKDNKIIDTDIALALIHYCITGKTNPAEFELVLPKILCGIPIQEAVILDTNINIKFQDEAHVMLMAVIEHWSVLKGSSIIGLRESFLQRAGKLSINNKQWLLQVEQQSYDLLLQHLPWNISMIKLPWMTGMLITEWV